MAIDNKDKKILNVPIWDLLFSNYMYNILIYDYGTENN